MLDLELDREGEDARSSVAIHVATLHHRDAFTDKRNRSYFPIQAIYVNSRYEVPTLVYGF